MKHLAIVLLSALNFQLAAFGQGPLAPPGPPAPTMKSLDQVEPRTPISALPATISTAGSYYLATNLTCTGCGGGTNGITIATGDVTVDLRGFALIGVAGSGDGIFVSSTPTLKTNIAIRNGILRNWGISGAHTQNARNSQLERLFFSDNGTFGLQAGAHSLVIACSAFNNGAGISVPQGCRVESSVANANANVGFFAAAVAGFFGCTARTNGTIGIQLLGANCSALNCDVSGNDTGIEIDSLGGCMVMNNNCSSNGIGIFVAGPKCRIEGNYLAKNDVGIHVNSGGTSNLIIRNSATLNKTNYFFEAAVFFGPTNNVFGTGGIITNQNPWANFSY